MESRFHRVVKHNLRTWPILNRLLPWNWLRVSTGVETLAAQYERYLTRRKLQELPERPRFLINATDLPFAVNWTFDSRSDDSVKGRMGDYQAGYRRPFPDWPLAKAVAASSCFPPVFNPLPTRLKPDELVGGKYAKPDRDKIVAGMVLSDGGVYDNLGLEPVWKDHAVVLVSDGGGSFEPDAARGLLWRLQRYVTVADGQVRALRKRWLISNFISGLIVGTYWGIGSAATNYHPGAPGYPEHLVDDIIEEVRPDLDVFSDAEIGVLENHGYLLAAAAIERHIRPLVKDGALSHLVLTEQQLNIPHPQWWRDDPVQVDVLVREALKESHNVRLLGRR